MAEFSEAESSADTSDACTTRLDRSARRRRRRVSSRSLLRFTESWLARPAEEVTQPRDENPLSPFWNPSVVAIKVVPLRCSRTLAQGGGAGNTVGAPGEEEEALREGGVMALAGPHPTIVRFHSCFVNSREQALCVVEEWVDGPTLGELYSNLGLVGEEDMITIALDLLHALHHLHVACRTIHRDIKPTNVLLTRRGVAKLADLGVSGTMEGPGFDMRKTYVGTTGFMAPEVAAQHRLMSLVCLQQPAVNPDENNPAASGAGYTATADVWSLGVTLLEGAVGTVAAHEYATKVMRMYDTAADMQVRVMALNGPQPASPVDLPSDSNVASWLLAFLEQHRSMWARGDVVPFRVASVDDVFLPLRKAMAQKLLDKSFQQLSPEFVHFILSMVDPLPSRRPTTTYLLMEHPLAIRLHCESRLQRGPAVDSATTGWARSAARSAAADAVRHVLWWIAEYERSRSSQRAALANTITKGASKKGGAGFFFTHQQAPAAMPIPVSVAAAVAAAAALTGPKQLRGPAAWGAWNLVADTVPDILCGFDAPFSLTTPAAVGDASLCSTARDGRYRMMGDRPGELACASAALAIHDRNEKTRFSGQASSPAFPLPELGTSRLDARARASVDQLVSVATAAAVAAVRDYFGEDDQMYSGAVPANHLAVMHASAHATFASFGPMFASVVLPALLHSGCASHGDSIVLCEKLVPEFAVRFASAAVKRALSDGVASSTLYASLLGGGGGFKEHGTLTIAKENIADVNSRAGPVARCAAQAYDAAKGVGLSMLLRPIPALKAASALSTRSSFASAAVVNTSAMFSTGASPSLGVNMGERAGGGSARGTAASSRAPGANSPRSQRQRPAVPPGIAALLHGHLMNPLFSLELSSSYAYTGEALQDAVEAVGPKVQTAYTAPMSGLCQGFAAAMPSDDPTGAPMIDVLTTIIDGLLRRSFL